MTDPVTVYMSFGPATRYPVGTVATVDEVPGLLRRVAREMELRRALGPRVPLGLTAERYSKESEHVRALLAQHLVTRDGYVERWVPR